MQRTKFSSHIGGAAGFIYSHNNESIGRMGHLNDMLYYNFSVWEVFMRGFLLLLLSLALPLQAQPYKTIEFMELLPAKDLQALSNPPEDLLSIEEGSLEDQVAAAVGKAVEQSANKEPQNEWERALQSTDVRPEYNGKKIRIPGFVVPLEFDDQQVVTEFFLVPYYGACIHLPPPPPNQIILMQSKKGVYMDTIYDPYWIEGTLYTDLKTNELATSAYRMVVDKIELYVEPVPAP